MSCQTVQFVSDATHSISAGPQAWGLSFKRCPQTPVQVLNLHIFEILIQLVVDQSFARPYALVQ